MISKNPILAQMIVLGISSDDEPTAQKKEYIQHKREAVTDAIVSYIQARGQGPAAHMVSVDFVDALDQVIDFVESNLDLSTEPKRVK